VNKKLAAALSGGTVLVLALSGCGGGDDGQRTEEWVDALCSEVRPQVERIRTASGDILEAAQDDRPPEEVQQTDSAAFQEISDAYAALADAVNEAGDPPVDDGARLREDAVTELRTLSDSYAELKETVEGLDTSDQGEFSTGLQDIADRLEELAENGGDALSELQEGELGEAMAENEGCQNPAAASTPSQVDDSRGPSDDGRPADPQASESPAALHG
jgi:cell division septation protein DedD